MNGTFVNSFAYTGAVIDPKTGLYYMNARYYDPQTGRFISQDSYKGDGEDFWHAYLYCEGDPVDNTDPTGHKVKARVFASKEFESWEDDEIKRLKTKYPDIEYAKAVTVDGTNQFVRLWNSLGSEYKYVSLIFHAQPYMFACRGTNEQNIASSYAIEDGAVNANVKSTNALTTTNKSSSIKKLYLMMCNAGHRFHKRNNLAKAFRDMVNKNGDVLSCDGTNWIVRNGRYDPCCFVDVVNDKMWVNYVKNYDYKRDGGPKGFYWWKNGNRVPNKQSKGCQYLVDIG